jgi:hypothetical protein
MILAKDLSPDAQFAFAVFQHKEKARHLQDVEKIEADLERLRAIGVDVDLAATVDMGYVTTEPELGFA